MRKAILGLVSASFLLTAGCTQQPPAGGDSKNPPPPPKPAASAPAVAPSAAASAAPASAAPSAAPASPGAAASTAPMAAASGAPASGAPASGAPAEGSEAVKKLQDDTGLTLKAPAGLKEEVKEDGEIQFTEGDKLFVAIAEEDELEGAVTKGVEHLKKIDKDMKEPETKDMEEGGVKAKAARGTLKIEGKEMQWMVLAFDGGKGKVMRVVLMGEELQKNKTAEEMVNSIKKK